MARGIFAKPSDLSADLSGVALAKTEATRAKEGAKNAILSSIAASATEEAPLERRRILPVAAYSAIAKPLAAKAGSHGGFLAKKGEGAGRDPAFSLPAVIFDVSRCLPPHSLRITPTISVRAAVMIETMSDFQASSKTHWFKRPALPEYRTVICVDGRTNRCNMEVRIAGCRCASHVK